MNRMLELSVPPPDFLEGERALRVGVKEEGKQDSSGQFQVWNWEHLAAEQA